MSSELHKHIKSLQTLIRIAPRIRDHKDLETKLTSAPPHLREVIYEAVRPHLKFKAKELDRYIIAAQQMAERERLPTMDEHGNLHEFAAVEVGSTKAIATKTLTLVCHICTREDKFFATGAETNVDVILKARREGWVYEFRADPPHEICPNCPTELRRTEIDA